MTVEQFTQYEDNGGSNEMFGRNNLLGSQSGTGTSVATTQWWSTINRHARQRDMNGTGGGGFVRFDGNTMNYRVPGLFLPEPAARRIVRARSNIGFEYVAGAGVSRGAWGWFVGATADILINNGIGNRAETGAICFQWRQIGAGATNLFAIVSDLPPGNAAVNIFSQDTGVQAVQGAGGPLVHSLRIDLDPTAGEIRFYIANVLVATYTVVSGAFATNTVGTNHSLGAVMYCENANNARLYDAIGGESGFQSVASQGI